MAATFSGLMFGSGATRVPGSPGQEALRMRGSLPAQARLASRREWKMRRGSRGAALVVVAALVLLPGAAATARHVAGTQTFTVNVDGTPKSANLGFDAYFPKATTIHAG